MGGWDFIGDVVGGFIGVDDKDDNELKGISKKGKAAIKLKQTPEAAKTVIGEEVTAKDTVTETTSDQEVKNVFNQAATDAVSDLTKMLTDFSGTDQQFYENIFQPYQESLISANQEMLPLMKGLNQASIDASLKALQGNDVLRASFQNQATGAITAGTDIANRFMETFNNMPTTEDRVNAARVGIEASFGQARAEIKRNLAAKGQTLGVGQARTLNRNLAIEKAKAKSSATDTAAEAARRERSDILSAGVSIFGGQAAGATQGALGVSQASSALNTGQLTGIQGTQGGIQAAAAAAGAISPIATRQEGQTQSGVTAGTSSQTGSASNLAQINPPGTPGSGVNVGQSGNINQPGQFNLTGAGKQTKSGVVNKFFDEYEGLGIADGTTSATGSTGGAQVGASPGSVSPASSFKDDVISVANTAQGFLDSSLVKGISSIVPGAETLRGGVSTIAGMVGDMTPSVDKGISVQDSAEAEDAEAGGGGPGETGFGSIY